MSEPTSVIPLRVRSRFRRALRWPVTLRSHHRAGLSWLAAWRLTHWAIWYQVPRG